MKKRLVDTNKLYSVIGRFFPNSQNLVSELIQNSLRAKAANIIINLPYRGEHPFPKIIDPDKLLRIEDDGKGITDIAALLGIAISKWDSDINWQDPAGMGFLQLIALSKQVFVQSAFGSLIIESERFLNDSEYRDQTFNNINKTNALKKGTVITAEMKDCHYNYIKSDLSWYCGCYNAGLVINGELMNYQSIEDLSAKAEKRKSLHCVREYKGNRLFVEIGYTKSIAAVSPKLINWYGQFIPVFPLNSMGSKNYVSFYYEVIHL